MVNFTILAGGFSSFIATYVFDTDAGALSLVAQNNASINPSWIASHLTNKSILYAVSENSPVGSLQSFTVDGSGILTKIDEISTDGNGPTFTNPLSTGEVTGMNFGSPNASVMRTDPNDPTQFIATPDVVFPVPEGGKSNPHMSLEVNGEVLMPDLGGDKIWRVTNNGTGFAVTGQIDVDPGTGPRHIAMLGDILFTVHETASTLTAQLIPQGPNGTTLPLIANVTTVDPTQAAINGTKFAAAEILISTPTDQFPDPLIYVSNRNIGETVLDEGDTIAIFQFVNGTDDSGSDDSVTASASASSSEIPYPSAVSASMAAARRMIPAFRRRQEAASQPQGTLKLIAQIPTGLQQIRSMALGSVDAGTDQFLIAGANTQGGVAMFQRVDGGRNLTLVTRNLDVANRTSFVFL